jgi:hypothetical protein
MEPRNTRNTRKEGSSRFRVSWSSQDEVGRGDEEDEFAFEAEFGEAGADVGGGADEEGFVELGDLLRDADHAGVA